MGPILPFGFERPGWFDRAGAIGDFRPFAPGGTLGGLDLSGTSGSLSSTSLSTQSVSALAINNGVSQLLRSIGGGLENNKMLELMIALMILMALLEEQTQQSDGGASALSLLGSLGGRGDGVYYSSFSYSSSSISFEYTSLSFTSSALETFRAISQPGFGDGDAGQRFDLHA